MKNIFTALLFFISISLFSQETEKRLALVIGNSNYDKGELKNPVNDALLISETLKKLEFDVILDTNIVDKRSFKETIRKFGNKRSEYDVAFVYYAGHGIQVGSQNYLLPTKEVFESEYDVEDYGVSVQDIMRYLTGMSDQVNVLILDACRDNPFEVSWNATRSLKGSGLAKIPPPTGSLIAFSTDAGNTAADGDGANSIYCESLCENMLLENTSLDQVFRNVRSDVLEKTNSSQRPVEASQLTGSTYYLTPPSNKELINKVDEYLVKNIQDSALVIVNSIISFFPNESIAYAKRGHIHFLNNNMTEAYLDYSEALRLEPSLCEAIFFTISTIDDNEYDVGITQLLEFDESIHYLEDLLFLDPNDSSARIALARLKIFSGDSLLARDALRDLNYLDSLVIKGSYLDSLINRYQIPKREYNLKEAKQLIYNNFAYAYQVIEDFESVILYMKKSLKLNRKDNFGNAWCYFTIADSYYEMNKLEQALSYFTKAINADSLVHFVVSRGKFYKMQKKYDLAIKDCKFSIQKGIEKDDILGIGRGSVYLSQTYIILEKNYQALRVLSEGLLHLEKFKQDPYSLLYIKELLAIRINQYQLVDEIELMCLDIKQYINLLEQNEWLLDSGYSYELIGDLDEVKKIAKTYCK